MRPHVALFALLLAAPLAAEPQERIPGEHWMRYADPADAGFDARALEEAHETWKRISSSAFMVVADGAVVVGWGDLERRFMCHSVRKSFLSALFGIYVDRGQIGIAADVEADRDLRQPAVRALRLHVGHALDAVDGLFERRGDGRLHRPRALAEPVDGTNP